MKINLTDKEIADIVKEWAMMTYRTKNVSVLYQIDLTPASLVRAELSDDDYVQPAKLKSIGIELEIILNDQDYGNATSHLADEAIKRVQKQAGVANANGTEADLSPRFNDIGSPL